MGKEQIPKHVYLDFDTVVTREDWHALDMEYKPSPLITPATDVIFTYTGTKPCSTKDECVLQVHKMQRMHMKNEKFPDIPYSFLIGGDGSLFVGQNWLWSVPVPPSFEEKQNSTVVIAYIGPIEDNRNQHEKNFKQGYAIMHCGLVGKLLNEEFTLTNIPQDWNKRLKDSPE